MDHKTAVVYLKNIIEFNNLKFGSVQQVSKVIDFLKLEERATKSKEAQNTSTNNRYVTALEILEEYKWSEDSDKSHMCFKSWLDERINATK